MWVKPRKKVTAELMKDALGGITFEVLPNLETYIRDRLCQPEPQQKRLRASELYPLTCTIASNKQVVRVEHPKACQHLRGLFDLRKCSRDWKCAVAPRTWRDISVTEAVEHVKAGGSVFVQGIAGTGKSHLIRESLIPALRAMGKKIISLAKTHAAAAITEGDTVDHFSWKHVREGGTGVDVIWVDEVSMLDIELLCDLSHANFRDPPPQWILSGDFNQYLPFFNSFRGKAFSKSFEDSELLHAFVGGNRITLTECRRSDAHLFAFYASLIPGGSRHGRSLKENVMEARQIFNPSKATGFIQGTALAPTNLVLSHRLRVELNSRCNQADAKGREGVEEFLMKDYYSEEELEYLDQHVNQPQDALIWPGMVMISRCTTRKLKNALASEVLGFEEDRVRLGLPKSESDRAERAEPTKGEWVELTRKAFFRSMRLQYALTYASIQGVTIKTLLALYDTSHPHFDSRHLFVGTSRAIASDVLVVY